MGKVIALKRKAPTPRAQEAARFGACPHCGQRDGYVNAYDTHYFLCHQHKTMWGGGKDLFPSWRHETKATCKRMPGSLWNTEKLSRATDTPFPCIRTTPIPPLRGSRRPDPGGRGLLAVSALERSRHSFLIHLRPHDFLGDITDGLPAFAALGLLPERTR
jgi:hypothetical protein